jgi:hypothetical protein
MSRTTPGDTAWLDAFELTPRQRDFVLAYLQDPNAKQAALAAGYAERSAQMQGSRLISNDKVGDAITEGRKLIEQAAMMDADRIARRWADIATADATDLVQNIIGACRYCYGTNHDHQWKTPREYREALEDAARSLFEDDDLIAAAISGQIEDGRLPNDAGGYGYRITDDPNPACPECAGLGIEYVRIADTRKLTGPARLLYDGVEETKQGRKVKLQDRAKALDSLAKHLGMFAGKVDPEEINPLERLAQALVANATAVPVRADPTPDRRTPAGHPLDQSAPDPSEDENQSTYQDDEDVDP